jgi:hypothetical protein
VSLARIGVLAGQPSTILSSVESLTQILTFPIQKIRVGNLLQSGVRKVVDRLR